MENKTIDRWELPASILRKGDPVYFYVDGHRTRIEGVVSKVNARSVKVIQTNDEYYVTKAAFGHYGGRQKGGKGTEWSVPIDKNYGKTKLNFTHEYAKLISATTRGQAHLQKAKRTAVERKADFVTTFAKSLLQLGITREELHTLIDNVCDEYNK